MARNKYPEETVQRILEIAFHLFTTKGYEKTSIQDIVDALGMSKGAIYHHFKSKEEILLRLCETFYDDMGWFTEIQDNPALNGLQKLEQIFIHELENEQKIAVDILTAPLVYNVRMVFESLKSAVNEVAPLIKEILEEGIADGSVHAKDPKDAAEILILLINMWINPGLFPVSRKRFEEKIRFYQELLDGVGIPLLSDRVFESSMRYYDAVFAKQCNSAEA